MQAKWAARIYLSCLAQPPRPGHSVYARTLDVGCGRGIFLKSIGAVTVREMGNSGSGVGGTLKLCFILRAWMLYSISRSRPFCSLPSRTSRRVHTQSNRGGRSSASNRGGWRGDLRLTIPTSLLSTTSLPARMECRPRSPSSSGAFAASVTQRRTGGHGSKRLPPGQDRHNVG